MNIPLTFPHVEYDFLTKDKLDLLRKECGDLDSLVDVHREYSDYFYENAQFYYYQKMCRLIHFLASRKLTKNIHQSNASSAALQEYFTQKIQLQQKLYQGDMGCTEYGRWFRTRNLDCVHWNFLHRAACVLHNDEGLTKRVMDYVNREEALFYSLLPREDQCAVFYVVYRDKIKDFFCDPLVAIISACLFGLGSLMAMVAIANKYA